MRNRPWLDITAPNVSGRRVDINIIAQTLDEWGGWNEVEAEWRWREFACAVAGLPSVTRDAGNRLRGFCLTHFGPTMEAPAFSNPRTPYWKRKEYEAAGGRVPTTHRPGGNALAVEDAARAVFFNADEEWVALPSWPQRTPREQIFRPGTSGLLGDVRFSRF